MRGFKRCSLIAVSALVACVAMLPPSAQAGGNSYTQTNLVSDNWVPSAHPDDLLMNPWGIAFFPNGPFWIADNNSGWSTLYDGAGDKVPLNVSIPLASTTLTSPPASPTGIVWNGDPSAFVDTVNAIPGPSLFLFATEDGTIDAWTIGNPASPNTSADRMVDNTNNDAATSPVYKGLAMGVNSTGIFLFATDFRTGKIDVFDSSFNPVTPSGGEFSFTDSEIPAKFAPFGIANINGQLWVSYAKQDSAKHDPVAGAGKGFVDIFDTDGHLVRRFAAGAPLNAPWGMVRAPFHFGAFSNDILIGNFGNGKINAFDPETGAFLDSLRNPSGAVIVNDGLWALVFGGGLGSSPQVLYFTAGLDSEMHGLFGTLTAK